MKDSQTDRVKIELLAKYHSFDTPTFSFQQAARAERPYRALIDELLTHWFLKEVTSDNRDVSFVYMIRDDSKSQWMIQLSMVGKYGVFFRLEGNGPTLLALDSPDVSGTEAAVRQILKKHEIVFLDKRTLTEPVRLRLFNTDPENVCIYQALFSDTDILPWSQSEKTG